MASTLGLCIDRNKVAQQDVLRECPKVLILHSISQQFFFNSTTRIKSVLALQTAEQTQCKSLASWIPEP